MSKYEWSAQWADLFCSIMLFSDESYCRWRRYLVLLSYLMEELTLVHSASRKSVTRLPEGTGIVDNWLARKQVLSDSPAALRKPPSLSNVFALVPVRAGIISSLIWLCKVLPVSLVQTMGHFHYAMEVSSDTVGNVIMLGPITVSNQQTANILRMWTELHANVCVFTTATPEVSR